MESVWSVSKLSTESVGSRRELVANSVHIADADAESRWRCVLGIRCELFDTQAINRSCLKSICMHFRIVVIWILRQGELLT